MRTVSRALTLAAAIVLLGAGPVMANSDVESDLAEMRQMVNQLQQQVQAQDEQLQAQGQQLDEAQQVVLRAQEDMSAVSGLSAFLSSVEVDGWVAGSYAWNTNNPSHGLGDASDGPNGNNGGNNEVFLPFHRNNNSFEVDQVWFGMGKKATAQSRAGFRFDMVYGQTATGLNQTDWEPCFDHPSDNCASTDQLQDYRIYQAYVEYLAPVGNGVNIKAGKFATLVGAEVAQTTQNFNITRGNLYTFFQPITHTGVLATTDVGPVSISFGLANSAWNNVQQIDNNKEKTYIVNAGWSQDNLGLSATVIYGAEEDDNNSNKSGLFDLVATFDPSDELSLWANFDYVWDDGSGDEDSSWGVAAAGRLALNDSTGISARAEYVNMNDDELWLFAETWSLTGTIDHMLVDNLMVRAEVRFDQSRARNGNTEISPGVHATYNEFPQDDGHNGRSRNQTVLLAELVYTF